MYRREKKKPTEDKKKKGNQVTLILSSLRREMEITGMIRRFIGIAPVSPVATIRRTPPQLYRVNVRASVCIYFVEECVWHQE